MLETLVRADSLRSIRTRLAEVVLGLAVFVAGCYTARLVTLTPDSSGGRATESARTRLTEADVRRAKQITAEIAAHFEFTLSSPLDAEARAELFDPRYGKLLARYSFAGLTSKPTYLALQLSEDHSQLRVAIQDQAHSPGRSEIVRLLQADFDRMFEKAFPRYEVKVR